MKFNKLVIFDLDGVLVDSRDLHFHALNVALTLNGLPAIPRDLHLSTYDGLPTKVKLDMLDIDPIDRNRIWQDKQSATWEAIRGIPADEALTQMIMELHLSGCHIHVATNSISSTAVRFLLQLGIRSYVSWIATPDTSAPKPSPEMYWDCMKRAGASAQTTVILEDSHIGREAAIASGAKLLPVLNRSEVTLERILAAFSDKPISVPYRDPRLHVVIPMGGKGSRFAAAGYTFPKPLIEINRKTMIQTVVENLNVDAKFTFVVDRESFEKYHLEMFLNTIAPDCGFYIEDDRLGAAKAVSRAVEAFDPDAPLLIANSDQFLEWNSNEVLHAFTAPGIDGGIVTFKATHPKWSYARLDESGFVAEVAEKQVISDIATTGVYYWKRCGDFLKYAEQMFVAEDRVNGEFYVCPVFNYAIRDGKKIRVKEAQKMWGLGTPEDLRYFQENYNAV